MKWCLFRIAALSLAFSFAAASAETIVFGDEVIERAVRNAIGKPTGDIDSAEVIGVGLTELTVDGFLVANLTGLEYLLDLTTLRLPNNIVANLTPLSTLANLSVLDLTNNNVTNVTPLGGLTNLRMLNLGMNMIQGLNGLAGLTNLRELNLSDNIIKVLGPLSGLTLLENLDLENNEIVDASPLLDNDGLGFGDAVNLLGNPLSQDSLCNVMLPLLERGVDVQFDGECPGVVEGTVLDEDTGEPVGDAIIVATAPLHNRGIGTTDFDGNFRMPDLASGQYTLTAYAPGYERSSRLATIETFMTTTVTFFLSLETDEDVALVPGATTDLVTGHTIAGVLVEAFSGTVPLDATFTGPSGAFELLIPITVKGTVITAELSAPGFVDVSVPIDTASTEPVQIQLTPQSTFDGGIEGNVFDGTLDPPVGLEGARVTAKATGGVLAFSDTTGITGAFALTNLADAEYSVQISAPTHRGDGIRRTVLVSDGGASAITQTLGSLPPRGGCASGPAVPIRNGVADMALLVAAVLGAMRLTKARR